MRSKYIKLKVNLSECYSPIISIGPPSYYHFSSYSFFFFDTE
uniref:Uncharacterized protein n=1 Tax=Heterorhabditis bacteriophora TaxID=37862 RepID=A0A1I7WSM1_HETBA